MAIDLSYLNKAQKQAVTHDQGPAILIAGAGTGKTTVISQRIAYLIEQDKAKAEEILAVTFTEKAAGEMAERVDKLLPLGYSDLWIHTFHGFCERVLKDYAIDIGLSNDFKLLDGTAAWLLIRNNLDKFNLDYYAPLGNPTRFIHALISHFSRLKDEVVYPEDYLKYAEDLHLDTDSTGDREEAQMEISRIREVANAYHIYQQLLLDSNALDFGDLINYTLKLFQKRPPILKKFREQFKYILVDEFQDTNWAQYELIKLLATPKNNLMVVGDDDQAIYKFRGAAISNILNFKKEYGSRKSASAKTSTDTQLPLCEIFLTDNYRSGQKILDTAYNFIQLNDPDRLEYQYKKKKTPLNKKLKSHASSDGSIDVLSYEDKNSEIDGILNKIVEIKKKDKEARWSDFAILVRANDQAQGFVSMMRKLGMPHQFMASRGLYTQDIVQDIIAYLKLLDNYHESPSFFRILSLPVTGLKIETIINLSHLASKKSWSLYYAAKNQNRFIKLPLTEERILFEILAKIDKHTELAKTKPVSQIIYHWLEDSGYLQLLTIEQNQYNKDQLHFLNQFYRKVRAWEEEAIKSTSVHEFLEMIDMELESGELGALQYDAEAGPDVVKVMTVHGAKGLEFKYVFVSNLVQLRFPSTERKDPIEIPEQFIKEDLPSGDAHLQEERRLFYVALTRAKEAVYLTWAKDYGGSREKKPSRFIDEIKIASQVVVGPIKEPENIEKKSNKPNYPLPKTFSFSQLKAFESCPWQYFYQFIAKVPTRGNAYFSFGKTMHSTLQKFYQTVIDRDGGAQRDLFSQGKIVKYPSEKELLDFYEESWIDDWYESDAQKKKYYQEGIKNLKDFYKSNKDKWTVPLFLEKGFTIKIGEYSVRGVFDRVDVVDGAWQIIDYKTGRPKDKLTFDDKKQLLLYQVAAEEVFKTNIKSLSFYYLANNELVSFVGTDKELIKVKEWARDIIDKILACDFTATPGFVCDSCDFNKICPYAKLNNK
ncbi:ATP-dependent helicase [Candidatus Parcubacteria bacterium]|nr:MAG: ATP-dependent helicase [Candidatus Parcubacteria bacterium]